MSILISNEELVERIQEIAEERKQSPEEVIAAAIASYAPKRNSNSKAFWESIRGIGNSGDPTLAERDEEILAEDIDPIRGWGSLSDNTDTDRH
jgi:hypothetical protein